MAFGTRWVVVAFILIQFHGLATYFRFSFRFSRRAVVSYWQKYAHEVLFNHLGGLSLPRKRVVRLTDRPDMTLDVYRGRKTTIQQQQQYSVSREKKNLSIGHNIKTFKIIKTFRNFIKSKYSGRKFKSVFFYFIICFFIFISILFIYLLFLFIYLFVYLFIFGEDSFLPF